MRDAQPLANIVGVKERVEPFITDAGGILEPRSLLANCGHDVLGSFFQRPGGLFKVPTPIGGCDRFRWCKVRVAPEHILSPDEDMS